MSIVKKRVNQRIQNQQVEGLPEISTVENGCSEQDICVNNSSVNPVAVGDRIQTDKRPTVRRENREWNLSKRWNPFNSYKLLAQVERWRKIKRGKPIPAPVLITVDPTNFCNLNCIWCNAEFVRRQRKASLSEKALLKIADFLPRWGHGQNAWEPGVQAICIAGGGEPLLNPATGKFIDKVVANDIDVGIVTNGTVMNKFVDSLSQAVWVGVSVDAGTKKTFNKLKGLKPDDDVFDRIIDNIAILADYANMHNNKLGWKHPAYGVSYKYLLYKDNIAEIYEATKLAKQLGCKNIHFRPAGTTWDKLGTEQEITFSQDQIALFRQQITMALELDDKGFGVYGVTHKFNSQFTSANYFSKCHSIFMTAVIEPPVGEDAPEDSFTVGLCCDRRGDAKLELARNIEDPQEIQKLWGSEKHWDIHDSIAIQTECPRCTYQPHNEIYEQVILNDTMTHKFI
ncbi:MAG: radical SAM protein [Planctomycetota bacterium]|jgi:sulfatase maturation enzyme AslB (radical SAM superfamily)